MTIGGNGDMAQTLFLIIALTVLALPARAADIAGTWQADGKPQRVLKIQKARAGYRGEFYNLGDEAPGAPRFDSVSAITLSGDNVHFSLDKAEGTFDGTLSADAKTLSGSWKMLYGPPSQQITFARTAPKDAWVTDASPHKVQFVTVQPGVKLEVLDWGGSGPPLIFLSGLGNSGHTFADNYDDQTQAWANNELFDWPFGEKAVKDAGGDELTLVPGSSPSS